MRELTSEEIKRSENETLLIFRDYCEKNNLKYYLAFGTLLGAVRHGGFIPWDDDIDVLMPREDYDFLIEHFNRENSIRKLISKETDEGFYLNFAKIIDTDTVVVEKGKNFSCGVWIDIFPLDYFPCGKLRSFLFTFRMNLINFILTYSDLPLRNGRGFIKNTAACAFHIFRPFRLSLQKKHAKLLKKAKEKPDTSKYGLLYIFFGFFYAAALSKDYFEPCAELFFEGEKYNVPGKYDEFLRLCYGDYMKLPPEKERKSHHSYTCYRKEDE